ncbi:DUF1207 domain-containing protein [Fibrisoma montanum]|uniref:DUF1207 domain-containing protein n=1 Tax=Fibrisoma montanum TaxID=2305895 RepID=A0A418M835_9BACT|nr:DUF1207 domain-containing protein [Fibrisoma montanum]RIV22196.1 DUF1207 domain-containing protein [Fibrisoma montanum]
MKKALFVFIFSSLVSLLALGQQPGSAPASSTATTPARTASRPAAPQPRPLTPEEQREKEKRERAAEKERQLRAKWAQEQREYQAKQAQKERERLAKKAEKERRRQEDDAQKSAGRTAKVTTAPPPAAVTPEPVQPQAQPQPVEPQQTEAVTTPAPRSEPEVRTSDGDRQNQREQERAARQAQKEQERLARETQAREARERKQQQKAAKAPAVISSPRQLGPDTVASVRITKEFLPKGHLFEPILLDPLEAQSFISVLPGYWMDGNRYKGSIVPFEFGFIKPIYRRTLAPDRANEWVLDVASYTQFEVYYDADRNRQRRQLINNDYKLSFNYNLLRGKNTWRFRLYHLSSHLGDDFIIRNRITTYTANPVNYELLDATYSRTSANGWRTYGGIGFVLRKSSERKLLSAQIGTYYRKPASQSPRLVGGVDVKFWQQTDFRPGIHAGLGLEVGRPASGITFLLEGYSGFRPYSQYEDQQTTWVGIGMYMNPF